MSRGSKIAACLMFITAILLIAGLSYDIYGVQENVAIVPSLNVKEKNIRYYGFRQSFNDNRKDEADYDCYVDYDEELEYFDYDWKGSSFRDHLENSHEFLGFKGNSLLKNGEELDPEALCNALHDSGVVSFVFALSGAVMAIVVALQPSMKVGSGIHKLLMESQFKILVSGSLFFTLCATIFSIIAFTVWAAYALSELKENAKVIADELNSYYDEDNRPYEITVTLGPSMILFATASSLSLLTSIYVWRVVKADAVAPAEQKPETS